MVLSKDKDLSKYIVGAQNLSVGWWWVKTILVAPKHLSQDNFRGYQSAFEAVNDLELGPDHVGAILLDVPVANAFIVKSLSLRIVLTIGTNDSYGFAVKI